MPVQKRSAVWAKENSVAEFIPYSAQVDQHTVKTQAGDYLQVIRVGGFAHESADEQDISIYKEQLNQLIKNIASPDIALWTHVIRMEKNTFPEGKFRPGFAADLNDKYRAHLDDTKMMVNKLYVTIIYRPNPAKVVRLFSKLDKKNKQDLAYEQQSALEKIDEVASILLQGLDRYNQHRLGCYESHGSMHSEVLEFLAFLINGDWQPFPLPRSPLAHALPTSRPFFGREVFEIRTPTAERFGAMLAIKEYPEETEAGYLNTLLSAPFPLVLTQSFTFLSRPVAIEMLKRQQARMINAGDLAESQIQAISDALDDLSAGRFVMGEHHLNLSVLADSPAKLKANLSAARSALADCSLVVAREDLALEAAYWAQLPGNFQFRPRPAPITSRNLAGFASLHNYPSGRRQRNQWGPAVTLLKTSSAAPYYFNFHEPTDKVLRQTDASLSASKDGKDEQKALANTVIIGPSGSGKTVVQGFLLAQAEKFKPTSFIFDKDRGLEIFVRAMGGVYSPLLSGRPTGFNPFRALEPTPHNLLFLEALTKKIACPANGKLTNQQEREISDAVRGVMTGLKPESRRLSSLLAFMDQTDPEGAGARLARWCARGPLGWVFDNEEDSLDFSGKTIFGFDVTEFLDDPEVRTPIIMYLFHRMEELIDGRRFMCFMDEYWKLLQDDHFKDLAQNKLKTIRKQNGFLVLGTQSTGDVLASSIAHSIIEQCATMLFFPNPKASEKDCVDGFKLTNREYQIIKEELAPSSRRFLVKQGHSSVVAELNLQGFDDELAVISGTTENVGLVNKLIEMTGDDPAQWLPLFHQQRK